MTNPLARALRELRGSPAQGDAGDAAGHDDAEDADTLARILAGLGLALVPVALDGREHRAVPYA